MVNRFIPFNVPTAAGREAEYVSDAMQSGHLAGDGPYTKRCHAVLESVLGAPKVLLTTSCTHALEMSMLLLNIGAGDEVIVPSFTFVSVVNAVVLRGARPVFADVRPDTLNLDESKLEGLITSRTRAVVVVHYAGVPCEMDAILAITQARGIAVVEDNAHGLFGTYKGRPLGTMGALSTLSFHETKNITCGEGGALVINRPDLFERAEIIREKGTNRSRFFRGQVDKYTWVDAGSSYLPSEILAAFLYGQLEERVRIQADRQRIWTSYASRLADWARSHDARLPQVPADCVQPFHIFFIQMASLETRQEFMQYMKGAGIGTTFHYLPLHLSEMGRRLGGRSGDCPVTESASDRLVRLPLHRALTTADVDTVVDTILKW